MMKTQMGIENYHPGQVPLPTSLEDQFRKTRRDAGAFIEQSKIKWFLEYVEVPILPPRIT